MNLRKIFYLPTEAQKAIMGQEIEQIMNKCDKIADVEWKEQRENQKILDDACPKCRARQENIVNKIRQVHGDGNVSGSFSLGFGSVGGRMSINTDEVNHCNKCGNEWKKYKIKYISQSTVLIKALNYLAEIIENPKEKKYHWKLKAIRVFDGCCAETIRVLVEKNQYSVYSRTKILLCHYNLRPYYKSVFDGENKKELKKI